jgi:hypothetical protein
MVGARVGAECAAALAVLATVPLLALFAAIPRRELGRGIAKTDRARATAARAKKKGVISADAAAHCATTPFI